MFSLSVIHPHIQFLTGGAAAGAVVFGENFHPFSAVGGGDKFGVRRFQVFS